VKARTADVIPIRRAPSVRGQEGNALGDEALVAACAVGDAGALGALFDRHHEALCRFLARLSRDPSEIDDLVQQTFVEVWRSAARFRAGSAVRTWMFGIAANLVRHRARSEGRRKAALADLACAAPVPSRGPDDVAIRRELVARMQAALADLPVELREVFVLCEIEEVPGVEAARVLGLRAGTVWRRLHDARKALRAALEGGAA
jgi:RNA polymerase sigma-70 factor (ECF subfamily)